MRSNVSSKSLIVFAVSLILAVWGLPTVNATAKTVILGGGAVAFEIVGEVNNSAPGVVPATSEIFGYLSKVDGIERRDTVEVRREGAVDSARGSSRIAGRRVDGERADNMNVTCY